MAMAILGCCAKHTDVKGSRSQKWYLGDIFRFQSMHYLWTVHHSGVAPILLHTGIDVLDWSAQVAAPGICRPRSHDP